MPYDPTDPRAQLATAAPVSGVPRAATYRELHRSVPDEVHAAGGRTWWTRSQALAVGYSEVVAGESIETPDVAGDHAVLFVAGATGSVEHFDGSVDVAEAAVVTVPAGRSTLHLASEGVVVRAIAADTAPDIAARCANADDYATADVNVAPYEMWPPASGGDRVRVYPLSAYPAEPGRLGSIFRCSTVMVNVLPEDDRPRDPAKLSPHHHDDFEQVSVQVAGDYVHHMRVPWTPDSTTWRDDEHRRCSGPAIVVIPPPLVHTSQGVGEMRHWLIDLFAPPRADFSDRPGWVLNADDFPRP